MEFTGANSNGIYKLGFENSITISFESECNEVSLLNQISISIQMKGGICFDN
jgi:hypothetical protein